MQSNIYAENIKKLRESENISQEVFAKHIGVSRNTVSSWERGIKVPSKDNIQKIMELFNVSKSYLIGDTDNRNINVFKGTDGSREIDIHKSYPYELTPNEVDLLLSILGQNYDIETMISKIRKISNENKGQ